MCYVWFVEFYLFVYCLMSLGVGHCLFVVCCWLLVVGCWLLVVGCCIALVVNITLFSV